MPCVVVWRAGVEHVGSRGRSATDGGRRGIVYLRGGHLVHGDSRDADQAEGHPPSRVGAPAPALIPTPLATLVRVIALAGAAVVLGYLLREWVSRPAPATMPSEPSARLGDRRPDFQFRDQTGCTGAWPTGMEISWSSISGRPGAPPVSRKFRLLIELQSRYRSRGGALRRARARRFRGRYVRTRGRFPSTIPPRRGMLRSWN